MLKLHTVSSVQRTTKNPNITNTFILYSKLGEVEFLSPIIKSALANTKMGKK